MKKIYNKLVRDNIPEIIKAEERAPRIRTLNDQEFIIELFKKLKEETEELIGAKDKKSELIKEIGDVYEVIDAIIDNCGLDKDEIIKIKNQRRVNRGGFQKRFFLESVIN